MTEEELNEAMCVGEEHPMWKGIMGIIHQFRESTIQLGIAVDSDSERAKAFGGVAVLDDLKEELEARRKRAIAQMEAVAAPTQT